MSGEQLMWGKYECSQCDNEWTTTRAVVTRGIRCRDCGTIVWHSLLESLNYHCSQCDNRWYSASNNERECNNCSRSVWPDQDSMPRAIEDTSPSLKLWHAPHDDTDSDTHTYPSSLDAEPDFPEIVEECQGGQAEVVYRVFVTTLTGVGSVITFLYWMVASLFQRYGGAAEWHRPHRSRRADRHGVLLTIGRVLADIVAAFLRAIGSVYRRCRGLRRGDDTVHVRLELDVHGFALCLLFGVCLVCAAGFALYGMVARHFRQQRWDEMWDSDAFRGSA